MKQLPAASLSSWRSMEGGWLLRRRNLWRDVYDRGWTWWPKVSSQACAPEGSLIRSTELRLKPCRYFLWQKRKNTPNPQQKKNNQHTKNPTTKFSKENTYITIQMTASMLLVILSLPQTWLLISKTAVASSHISLWSIILSHSTSEVFAVSDNHSLKSTRTCHNLEASSHHRITQGLKFEGTSRGHLVQPPFSSRTT